MKLVTQFKGEKTQLMFSVEINKPEKNLFTYFNMYFGNTLWTCLNLINKTKYRIILCLLE